MNIDLNLAIRVVITDEYLSVRLVSSTGYPWFEESVVDESLLPLAELRAALDAVEPARLGGEKV